MKRALLVSLFLAIGSVMLSAAKPRDWQTGHVVSFVRAVETVTRQTGSHSTTTGTVIGGNVDLQTDTSSGGSTSHIPRYQLVLETPEYIYYTVPRVFAIYQHRPQITENSDIRYAINGSHLIVIDDVGHEVKMAIEKRVQKGIVAREKLTPVTVASERDGTKALINLSDIPDQVFASTPECNGIPRVLPFGKSQAEPYWFLAFIENPHHTWYLGTTQTPHENAVVDKDYVELGVDEKEAVRRTCALIARGWGLPGVIVSDSDCDHMPNTEAEGYLQARVWMSRHPEFNLTAANAKTLMDYLISHDLCPNQANLDRAYAAVKSKLK